MVEGSKPQFVPLNGPVEEEIYVKEYHLIPRDDFQNYCWDQAQDKVGDDHWVTALILNGIRIEDKDGNETWRQADLTGGLDGYNVYGNVKLSGLEHYIQPDEVAYIILYGTYVDNYMHDGWLFDYPVFHVASFEYRIPADQFNFDYYDENWNTQEFCEVHFKETVPETPQEEYYTATVNFTYGYKDEDPIAVPDDIIETLTLQDGIYSVSLLGSQLSDWAQGDNGVYIKDYGDLIPNSITVNDVVYTLDQTDKTVAVSLNGEVKIFHYSAQKSNESVTFTLKKVDGKTDAPLPGAEFAVYTDEDCTSPATGVTIEATGENGETTVTLPVNGTYYLKETKAPAGYVLGGTIYQINTGSDASSFFESIWNWMAGEEPASVTENPAEFNSEDKVLTVKNTKGIPVRFYLEGLSNTVDYAFTDAWGTLPSLLGSGFAYLGTSETALTGWTLGENLNDKRTGHDAVIAWLDEQQVVVPSGISMENVKTTLEALINDGYLTDKSIITTSAGEELTIGAVIQAPDDYHLLYTQVANNDDLQAGSTYQKSQHVHLKIEKNPGTLVINKTFSGIEALPDTFRMEVINEEGTVIASLPVSEAISRDGIYTWTLTLSAGSYTVKETGYSAANYTVKTMVDKTEADSTSADIVKNERTEVSFVNTYTASEIPTPPVFDWEKSKSKSATELVKQNDGTYTSDVTLSLPSAQETLESDVVFVLDKSTSADVEDQMIEMLGQLSKQAEDTGATINVGVVIFNIEANEVLPLTALTDENMDKITNAIRTEIKSGTNTHAGLLAGKAMLDEDSDVAANRKYLIFVSDGITYAYNEAPTILKCYWLNDNSPYYSMDPYSWSFKYGNDEPPADWNVWMGNVEALLESNTIEEALYADKGNLTGGTEVQKNSNNYVTSVDKALYLTYSTYQDVLEAGYHCYAMGATTDAAYAWGPSFMKYLAAGQTVSFDDIQNDIYYLLDAGSYVVDEIGSGTDNDGNAYNFDFVNDIDKLTLTVNGVTLDKEKIADNTYGFGKIFDGKYRFVVTYYKDGTEISGQAYGECFVWQINEAVSNFAPVSLTYTVKLTNAQTSAGTYGQYDADGSKGYTGLYTNNGATLFPMDSNGTKGAAEEFNKPTVAYTVSGGTTPTPNPDPTPGPDTDDDDDDDDDDNDRPPVVIEDDDTPLNPNPGQTDDGVTDIGEVEVPQGSTPDAPDTTDDPVEITDDGVPMGNLPQTGTMATPANPTVTLGALAMSASLVAAGLAITISRKREEDFLD